jgi:hypothetical protein
MTNRIHTKLELTHPDPGKRCVERTVARDEIWDDAVTAKLLDDTTPGEHLATQ